jgi:hypothetical protein
MENKTPPMPAKRALAALDQPALAAPDKPRRISTKVRSAIQKMVSGDCKKITDAALVVGLSREHLSRELNKPHIAEFCQEVLRSLSVAAARAGAVKEELLDSDNEIVRDRASSFVLGLAGIAPAATPSLALGIEVRCGYVIDLSPEPGERPDAGMRIVSSTAKPVAIDHQPAQAD